MNLRQLTEWDPDGLHDLAAAFDRYASTIDDTRTTMAAALMFGGPDLRTSAWTGDARSAADIPAQWVLDLSTTQADSLRAVGRCARDIETRLRALHAELAGLRAQAQERGATIGDDGTVAADDGASPGVADDIRRRLSGLLLRADELDRDAAVLLGGVLEPTPGGSPGSDGLHEFGGARRSGPDTAGTPTVPALGTAPADVARWWNELSENDRTALLSTSPDRLGNLDGIPGSVRDLANRAVLDGERARLEEVARQLRAELDGNLFGGLFSNADAGLEQTVGKLAALDAIEGALDDGDRQLLALDLSGREAMAAVAVGNVDTAEHVAVYVPGTGSTVQDNLAGYDGQVATLRDTASSLPGIPEDAVAAVTWMNYQAPRFGAGPLDFDLNPAFDNAALVGAARLGPFLAGLDAAGSEPNVTVIGHSYGALTAGLALQQGAIADSAVFLGAPWIGTDDVTDLGLDPGAAYLVEAEDDFVADLGVFGSDPSWLPGLTHLPSGASVDAAGNALAASTGHSEYLTPGTTSAYEVAEVVVGAQQAVR